MISITMAARNAREWTHRALLTIQSSVQQLSWQSSVEILLLDDASEPECGIQELFQTFARESGLPVRIVRFHQNQHYSRVLSAALSLATGDKVFFLSNDMIFTPDYFRTLVEVSNNPTIGVVRGTSPYTDSHPEHIVVPQLPLRTVRDINCFSKYIFDYWQFDGVEDKCLSADAVLFNRKLIDTIGVVDTRYFGYFGDVDYGLRAIRAGFKLVCAKGAWIFHEGAGYVRDEVMRHQLDGTARHAKRMEIVQQAYEQFRLKWDPTLPATATELPSLDVPQLKAMEPKDLHQYFAPITLTPEMGAFVKPT